MKNAGTAISGDYILICSSFYNELGCYQFNGSTPVQIADSIWSHKLGTMSRIDGDPFLIRNNGKPMYTQNFKFPGSFISRRFYRVRNHDQTPIVIFRDFVLARKNFSCTTS